MVSLISYTTAPTILKPEQELEELITYCARVSNPLSQATLMNSTKLIKYLIEHKHWSPFEMASVCLEINTTRDIARQILRHRSFNFQEFSQRYADPTQDLGFSLKEARMQDITNRQNSIENLDLDLELNWVIKQKAVLNLVKETYSWAISKGLAKEVARGILPEGLTNSKLYMNGTIRSWIHYLEIRTAMETQKEHRLIAYECLNQLGKVFPSIYPILKSKEQ